MYQDAISNSGIPVEMIKDFTYSDFINAFRNHSIRSVFVFDTDHYDKFKYEIAYMENRYANEIIDFYVMFELISTLDYSQWTEEQFNFFKETLEKLEH